MCPVKVGMLVLLAGVASLLKYASDQLAPIWVSTGSGNHVGLLTYDAVFNAGIVAIAWLRPWRVLNLLGFAFTFGLGTLWGALQYTPAKFATTEPFLLLFFAMYVAIPVLHARRGDGSAGKVIDGSLLFGAPLVAFALQARLPEGERLPLALCAVAALYAGLPGWLLRRASTRLLGQAHAMLAVGFATLAIPLALSARATASVFALEGVCLLWLGLRQQRRVSQIGGVALQVLAAVGVAFGVDAWRYDAVAVANATCMSTLLIALAGCASAWFLRDAGHPRRALVAYLWGLGWWPRCCRHCGANVARSGNRRRPMWLRRHSRWRARPRCSRPPHRATASASCCGAYWLMAPCWSAVSR